MLVIGTSKEAIVAAKQSIMEILKCVDAEQETKRRALEVLATICNVNGTVVSNNVFTNEQDRGKTSR